MNHETQPLLSRVADAVYWMARYVERAENVARFIGVNLHLQLDLPLAPANQWLPLVHASGDAERFREQHGEADEDNVIQFLAFDPRNLNSICSCLRAARENARSVRETISPEMWEQVNSMYLRIQSQQSAPQHESLPEMLRGIRLACHMFQGITDATMSNNEAWHFLRLGRMIERADKTSRILDVKYFLLLPSTTGAGTQYDDLHWSAVLKSVSGFETYRQKYGRLSPHKIVNFLVMDREFPRSIRHCFDNAEESLHAITGTPASALAYPSERLLGLATAELNSHPVDQVMRSGLHEYLDRLQTRMNNVDCGLIKDFFGLEAAEQAVGVGAAH